MHASLKNMVSRKTRLMFLVPESGGRTWRDKKIHDFHNFSNSGLKFYMRISEYICNRIMMKKKYRFFYPITGEAPLKAMCHTDAPPWSAREIASTALLAEHERHTESGWQIALRRGSTSSLSHSHEPYGAASVAPMRFCCVLSLLLSPGTDK